MVALGIALALFIPLALIGGIAALVFYLVRGGPRGAEGGLNSRTLLRAYLRFAYLVSLVIILVGVVNVLTSGFGAAFGKGFSYAPYGYACQTYSQPAPVQPGGSSTQPCTAPKDNRQADDLIRGISLLVAGLILGAGHRAGQLALETAAERHESGLARAEALLGTTGFGLVAIIAIPYAVYLVLRYALLGVGTDQSSTPEPPGGALASAIAFTPAWAYYLSVFVRRVRGMPSGGTTQA